MKNAVLDVIVTGAGHAGLSASYYLKKYGLNHLVFERGKIGDSWRTRRWTSFKLNTPNKLNVLPGFSHHEDDPDGFCTAAEFASTLELYASMYQLPVAENSLIVLVEKQENSPLFHVVVERNKKRHDYYSRHVIIASGVQNEIRIPSFADLVTPDLMQLHAGEYRNPDQLPDGAVLVAGSGQSGCQIAEDLLTAGKQVYLSTSQVPRVPRSYRGKDIMDWLMETQFFDARKEDISDELLLNLKAPQLTGTGDGKHSISLQSLAKLGAILLGKMEYIDEQDAYFELNAVQHVQFADSFSHSVKMMIDQFISEQKIDAPEADPDPEDQPDLKSSRTSSVSSLNLKKNKIRSIIWATGFNAGFNYIQLPVFDSDGNPIHRNGISVVPGLFFLGLPWLRNRKSTLIIGSDEDAKFITEAVNRYSMAAVKQFHNI
jgi:putative flavoprotein involved in K+ transport